MHWRSVRPEMVTIGTNRFPHFGQRVVRSMRSSRFFLPMAHWFHGEACVTMFHFANAAMLPLVGQKLALADRDIGTALMSVCIVAAQIVMVPMAMLVGANADPWGRKPLFLAGFAILPIRGALYTLSDNAYWLVGVQLLDGVGAGIFGARNG